MPNNIAFGHLLPARPDHWGAIENGLHYVRDEALGEDRSTIFRGHAPQNLAALPNAALNWLRAGGIDRISISVTLRSFARNPFRLFTKLGYQNEAKACGCPVFCGISTDRKP